MKKFLLVLLALVMVAGLLTACGDDGEDATANDNGAGTAQEADNGGETGEEDDYGMVETEDGYYQDFTFINSTAETLVELRASAGDSGQWRDNMLEGTSVGPEEMVTLSLYIIPGDTTDFRVVAENGAEHELRGYELEEFSTLELVANEDGTAVIVLS